MTIDIGENLKQILDSIFLIIVAYFIVKVFIGKI